MSLYVAELGHYALWLAFCVSLFGAYFGGRGVSHNAPAKAAKLASAAALGLVAIAYAALTQAYINSDFTLLNVVSNSHSDKPLLYKISGVWGNHEGSLLFWCLLLAGFARAVHSAPRAPLPLRSLAGGLLALLLAGFLALSLFTANPFARLLEAPANGQDLNPLLQDIGLAIHPPLLYLGYVGFSAVFALALAGLYLRGIDKNWAQWVRPWVLLAWGCLTLGLALGSWWAYYELGWGGWWFWDPVENAALVPWLTGTALLHSLVTLRQSGGLKRWTVLLALLTFATCLLGTFLVRSGVLTSVHAFANDPARGLAILLLFAVTVGGALALYAWRAADLHSPPPAAAFGREGQLQLNNLFMACAAGVVLLGTVYPLLLEALALPPVSVGAPFYNSVVLPLFVPALLLMGLAPFATAKRAAPWPVMKNIMLAVAALLLAALLIWDIGLGWGLGGLALGLWVMVGTIFYARQHWRAGNISVQLMVLAHFGFALAVLGMAGSALAQSRVLLLLPGQSTHLAGYDFSLIGFSAGNDGNYDYTRAHINVTKAGTHTILLPEKRWYPVAEMATTEAAISTNGLRDLYATLGDQHENGWTMRFYVKPLMPWLWFGAALVGLAAIGGAARLWRKQAQDEAQQNA